MKFYTQFLTENTKHYYLCPSLFQITCKGRSTLLRELTDLLYYRQYHTLYIIPDRVLIYDERFKMLKYNNMFTHIFIHYSEGKSHLNNKNETGKHNNKNLIMVYLFIHILINVMCQRM